MGTLQGTLFSDPSEYWLKSLDLFFLAISHFHCFFELDTGEFREVQAFWTRS